MMTNVAAEVLILRRSGWTLRSVPEDSATLELVLDVGDSAVAVVHHFRHKEHHYPVYGVRNSEGRPVRMPGGRAIGRAGSFTEAAVSAWRAAQGVAARLD